MKRTTTTLLLMGLTGTALAAPGFDRPGTAFNPDVLAPGSIAWEQGLPDVTKNKSNGVTEITSQYDSRLRIGLVKHLEVQLFGNPYEVHKTDGVGDDADGPGNAGLAFKVSLPTQSEGVHVGMLASLEFNTGKYWSHNYDSEGKEARTGMFGITSSWDLSDKQSVAVYGDITRTHKDDVYTFSPSWSYSINDAWGAYVEYKVSFGDLDANDNLAGGGVTWMASNNLQLDLYSNFGLTDDSTDLEAGFGVSWLIR